MSLFWIKLPPVSRTLFRFPKPDHLQNALPGQDFNAVHEPAMGAKARANRVRFGANLQKGFEPRERWAIRRLCGLDFNGVGSASRRLKNQIHLGVRRAVIERKTVVRLFISVETHDFPD